MKYTIVMLLVLNLICWGVVKDSENLLQEELQEEVQVEQEKPQEQTRTKQRKAQEEVQSEQEGAQEEVQIEQEEVQEEPQEEVQIEQREVQEEAEPEQEELQEETQTKEELQEETPIEQKEVQEETQVEQEVQEETQIEQIDYINISPDGLHGMLQTPESNFLFINTHIPYQGEIASTDNFIPFNEIEIYFPALPKDKGSEIVVYGMSGDMSVIASETLVSFGYTNVKNLAGGMVAWQEAGYELHDAFGKREDLTVPDLDRVSSQIGVPRNRFIKVDTIGDPYIGSLETPLVLVEFSDFNCPYCSKFHSETLPEIVQTYVETNQLRYVYRDLVSVGGASSFGAAVAAECTREQINNENYFVLINQLYASSGRKSMEGLVSLANNMEIDIELVLDCLEAQSYEQEVTEDLEAALGTGARGTPVFVLGFQTEENLVEGIVFQGALPLGMLSNYINAFLEASVTQ